MLSKGKENRHFACVCVCVCVCVCMRACVHSLRDSLEGFYFFFQVFIYLATLDLSHGAQAQ